MKTEYLERRILRVNLTQLPSPNIRVDMTTKAIESTFMFVLLNIICLDLLSSVIYLFRCYVYNKESTHKNTQLA